MVSRHDELACSQTRDDCGRFASGHILPLPPALCGSSASSSSIQVWLTLPVAKNKEEVVMEVHDNPPEMRVSY
jgi:hypothetical protein